MATLDLKKFSGPVKKCYEKCTDDFDSFEISLNNFTRKLKISLKATFGEKVFTMDEESFISCLQKIHTADLYLTMGMSAGDEKAWEIFNQRFAPKINEFSQYYADDEDIAEDVFAYTKSSLFVKIKKTGKPKIDSYNGRGSLESWLKVIVYREVITHQKNRMKSLSLDSIVLGVEEDHDYDSEMKMISTILMSGFKSLEEKEKVLLREYYILKQPERILADKYDVNVSTISRRLRKICDNLYVVFFTLAKNDFHLERQEAKDMFSKFSKSWHSNVAEILV
ncbi:MAG TPA: sigma-70 family RNA polymerase sigma factor [Candidatus Marinimicrobia bacterium]|jgi:RNA polymerase sigma factor (sigma-70 family)|nr:sigma-70 family RNA polymerase sigma factor [Candidatus Neomarinimicrobiota bacterium]|tara:strand:- start:2068 stop:2907 length:840 start_codon:yes stop_codon:yes gene_type:complete